MKITPALVLLLIILILVVASKSNNKSRTEGFLNYYKCSRLPDGPINKDIYRDYKWNRVTDPDHPWDLYIPCGYTNAEAEIKNLTPDNPHQVVMSIPGCDQLVSKNRLWELLENRWGRKGASNIMPESFVLSNSGDRQLLKKYWMDQAKRSNHGRGPIMILKKNLQQKKGLLLTRDWAQISRAHWKNYRVAQKYLKNVYKIHGRKVNLRIYVAITCQYHVTRAYLYTGGKCIYTSKADNSNSTVAKKELDFQTNITSYKLDPAVYQTHPHDFYQLRDHIRREGSNPEILFKRINKIITQSVQSVKPRLCGQENLTPNLCFQLFGADVIFTPDLKPYLLEFNKGPSLRPRTPEDRVLKREMLEDLYAKMGLDVDKKSANPDRWQKLDL